VDVGELVMSGVDVGELVVVGVLVAVAVSTTPLRTAVASQDPSGKTMPSAVTVSPTTGAVPASFVLALTRKVNP
jgi:hypothetical protein